MKMPRAHSRLARGRSRSSWIPILLVCIACMTMLCAPVAAGPKQGAKRGVQEAGLLQEAQGPVQIQNAYLIITENSADSRFNLQTAGGDPLLYVGYSYSSYSTVRIDGNDVIAGGDGGSFEEAPAALPADQPVSIRSVWVTGSLRVIQTVSLADNPATGRSDVMEIRYLLENTDTVSHDVGLRILLDTMLGPNDGAPFYIPGTGAVSTETEFLGPAVPDYFIALDSLAAPTILAQGTMRGGTATPPGRLVIAGWGALYETPWEYTVTPGQPLGEVIDGEFYPDSAYALYWDPVALGPGSTMEVVTTFGPTDLSGTMVPPLSLSVTGPLSLDIVDDAYSPNPFTVMAFVQDTATGPISDIEVRIELPDGLSLAGSPQVQVVSLVPNEIREVSWTVQAESQTAEQEFSYTVFANTTRIEGANCSVTRTILVPALASATTPVKVTIVPRTINLASHGYFLAFVKLPEGMGSQDVDRASVACNGAQAVKVFTHGKFSRVFGAVFRISDLGDVEPGQKVAFTVTGIVKGAPFEGTDFVRVINRKIHGRDPCDDLGRQPGERLFEAHYRDS